MATPLSVHLPDHSTHHLEILGSELALALAQNAQYILAGGSTRLLGKEASIRPRRAGAQPGSELLGGHVHHPVELVPKFTLVQRGIYHCPVSLSALSFCGL